jgi:predicted nucleic acid-binding protein
MAKLGLRSKDAAHVACAIVSGAEYFLTTDKKILNKPIHEVQTINPVDFVRRLLDAQ